MPKLSAATTYSFKIKPYKRVNRRNLAPGLSSGFVATTRPTGVKLSSLSTSKKSVTVKWKKVASSGYQVQYSTSSSMKKAKNTYTNKKRFPKKYLRSKRAKSIISEFAHIKHIRTHRAKAAHATVLGAVKRQSPSNNLCRAQKTLDMPCPKWYYSKNNFIY